MRRSLPVLRELFGGFSEPKDTASDQVAKSSTTTERSESVLGANTHVEGTLEGDVTIQGKVIIGERGTLEGDLIGEAVSVSGVVRGDITARKTAILRTGRVWGNLRQEALMTEEGGFIQGLVTMEENIDIKEAITPPETVEEVIEEVEGETEKDSVPTRKSP
jgi:cytoskeletal protein CcmA (bactofilin family)